MPILVIVAVFALGAWLWSAPHVREAVKRDPAKAAFWGLALAALALVFFRTGRHWLAVGLTAALVWGPRVLNAIGLGKRLHDAASARDTAPRGRGDMSRDEALEIFGLGADATTEQMKERYRELMKSVHPDRGGSTYLAKRVNEAKKVLMGPS